MLDHPNALERAAGVTDHAAVELARRTVEQVAGAKRALRQALADRDAAVRAAAAASPGVRPGALACAVGLRADTVRLILRVDLPPPSNA